VHSEKSESVVCVAVYVDSAPPGILAYRDLPEKVASVYLDCRIGIIKKSRNNRKHLNNLSERENRLLLSEEFSAFARSGAIEQSVEKSQIALSAENASGGSVFPGPPRRDLFDS
jgi:hypothetical protein